jgi:hypothetical protein
VESIAEILFRRRAANLPPDALAEVFARLVWTMDDNGEEICDTLQQWIESGDVERARIALAFDVAFLYSTRDEMMTAFHRLCARFPELRPACDEILAAWDQQHKVT